MRKQVSLRFVARKYTTLRKSLTQVLLKQCNNSDLTWEASFLHAWLMCYTTLYISACIHVTSVTALHCHPYYQRCHRESQGNGRSDRHVTWWDDVNFELTDILDTQRWFGDCCCESTARVKNIIKQLWFAIIILIRPRVLIALPSYCGS